MRLAKEIREIAERKKERKKEGEDVRRSHLSTILIL
jgi:hypothetical protein